MTNTFAIQFNIFATGEKVSVQWFRHAYSPIESDEPDVWEEIERTAERIAARTGQEIDIISCWRDETGNVCGGERAGIRVRPS